MASVENKMVFLMAQKMGLEENKQLIEKAYELARLIKIKSLGGNAIALSEYAQSVMCLDLASTSIGISFDAEHALKLSGLKRNTYLNGLRTTEKLLDLTRDLTVNELCIQLGVTSATEKSIKLLDKYKETHDCDISHPQYVSMAVFQACRLDKIKMQRSKIMSFSRLKLSQWNILEKTWSKWVDDIAPSLFSSKKMNTIGCDLNGDDGNVLTNNETEKGETEDHQIEEYEIWKKRILEEAYKELEALKNEPVVCVK